MRELAKQIPAGSVPGRGGSSDKGCHVVPGGVQSPVWVEGSEEVEGSEGYQTRSQGFGGPMSGSQRNGSRGWFRADKRHDVTYFSTGSLWLPASWKLLLA